MAVIEPFYAELGRRIQRARLRLGLPQAELARRMRPELTRASIANIESGKQRVLCHTVVDLGRVLGVALNELLPAAETAAPNMSELRPELARKVGQATADEVLKSVSSVVLTRWR